MTTATEPCSDAVQVSPPEGRAAEPPPLLAVDGIVVRFGGVVANDHVSISCHPGNITALLGPNGAGKSTLFDVITGARRPAAGRIRLDGADITKMPAHARARRGIARTFQNLSLARQLSVFENVLLGTARFRNYGPMAAVLGLPRVRGNDRELERLAWEALKVVGLADAAARRAGDLPFGDLHRVEIARALALAPRLFMLDEPSAGMDRGETRELAKALLRIRDHWGISMLVVEHDLEFVHMVADYAYVLDFGQLIASGTVDEVLGNSRVEDAYLGTTDHA